MHLLEFDKPNIFLFHVYLPVLGGIGFWLIELDTNDNGIDDVALVTWSSAQMNAFNVNFAFSTQIRAIRNVPAAIHVSWYAIPDN